MALRMTLRGAPSRGGAAVDEVRGDVEARREGEDVGHGSLALLRAWWGTIRRAVAGAPSVPALWARGDWGLLLWGPVSFRTLQI